MKKQLYKNKKSNASKRGIDFLLTREQLSKLMLIDTCYYTGAKLNNIPGDPNKWSLDRIDSSQPYCINNVVVCSHAANIIKSVLLMEALRNWSPELIVTVKRKLNGK